MEWPQVNVRECVEALIDLRGPFPWIGGFLAVIAFIRWALVPLINSLSRLLRGK